MPTSVFSAVGADTPDTVSDVFPSGVSVSSSSGSGILRTTFESKGACRRSSDASAPHRLRYGDASEGLLQVCQFLLMNPWYNVFEIEYSLYGHKARVFGFMF